MLLEAGANIKDIQRRLGHYKLSTTMDTCSHVTQKIKENDVSILNASSLPTYNFGWQIGGN